MRALNLEEINILLDLGKKAQKVRKSLGFTVENVSKMIGVSQQLIFHFEHGRANNCVVYLKLRTFYDMCLFYNINKDYIPHDIEEKFRWWLEDEIY